MQQYAILMSLHMFDHVTTLFSSFVSNRQWDSICFVVVVFHLFDKHMGVTLLDHRINIKFFSEIGEKCQRCSHKYCSKFTERGQ